MNDFTEVRVIEDSIGVGSGVRLTTVEAEYPRFIHAELMTHRVFSRNAASSRAVPVATMISRVESNPVLPLRWGKNQPGMQAADANLSDEDAATAEKIWREMVAYTCEGVRKLNELGLHKQWANRPLEWFSTIKVLITSTEWENFFGLRIHPAAQPEFDLLASKISVALNEHRPRPREHLKLDAMNWHLPYITAQERLDSRESPIFLARLSAARVARVSYLKHDGTPSTVQEDLNRFERLVADKPIHASPTEHQAYPVPFDKMIRNFQSWRQFRCVIEDDWARHSWGDDK